MKKLRVFLAQLFAPKGCFVYSFQRVIHVMHLQQQLGYKVAYAEMVEEMKKQYGNPEWEKHIWEFANDKIKDFEQ